MPAAKRFLVELDHREQIALIGEGHGRHAGRRDGRHQARHAHDSVDQRVLGVQPQVNEFRQGSLSARQAHRLERAPMQRARPVQLKSALMIGVA